MAPTRQTMACALALETGEFFDKLAEGEKDLKAAELHAAADYANQVAEQFRKWACGIEALEQKRREERRANKITKYVDENGVLVMIKGSPAYAAR